MFEASLGRRSAYGGVVHDWSLANYAARAASRSTSRILARSLGLALVTTVALPGSSAYPVAYWLAPAGRRALAQRAARPGDPALLDELPRAHVRLGLPAAQRGAREPRCSARSGLPALNLLYNDFAVLLGQVYGELPFMILPLYASLEKLDRSLLEAAADLGAAPARALWRVTLPLTAPGHRGRLRARLHPVAGRVPGPGPAGRRAHRLRRQPDPEPVRGGARHAVRRRALVPALPRACCSLLVAVPAAAAASRRRPDA